MRTTVTLDDDVEALVEHERARAGETFKQTINRLLRRSLGADERETPELPLLPGRLQTDIADVSAVLAAEDDEHDLAKRLI